MKQEGILYYCSNCEFRIPDEVEYKAHYRSDFHRYNIRRKLLSLEPVTFEIFQKKFLETQSNTSCTSSQHQNHFCTTCSKAFLSTGTYNQHINSNKHKQMLKQKILTPNPEPKVKLPQMPQKCLFCDISQNTLDEIMVHMNQEHGFFIREQKCLIDLEGLLVHLRSIIDSSNTCFQCQSVFQNGEANRQHMVAKGHCFMPAEEYNHLSQYYDFSAKLNALIMENPQVGIIEVDEESDEESDIMTMQAINDTLNSEWESVPLTEEQLKAKATLRSQLNQIRQNKATLLPNGEVQLPNGKILGHRIFKKYYEQCHVIDMQDMHIPRLAIGDEGTVEPIDNKLNNIRHHEHQIVALNQGLWENKIRMRYLRKRE